MRQPEAFLIDLDGVIYSGNNLIPGADAAIRFLDTRGFPYRFISNTTRKSRSGIADRLSGMGLGVPVDSIFTPASAAASYLVEMGFRSGYFLTTKEVADEICRASGVSSEGDHADVVVVGDAGDGFTYAAMNRAFRYLLDGAALVALERDRRWMGSDGMMLSAGPFVAALEYATGKEACVVGKPSAGFFRTAVASMGLDPRCVTMIGDDIETDVGGAVSAGLTGILVRTGKYREETLAGARTMPSDILDSIADLPGWISMRTGSV